MSLMRRPFASLLPFLAIAASVAPDVGAQEILWDRYGVPHIRGESLEEVAWAFGWAQAESHGSLLLRLYGQARGRAAEYWGQDFVESDRWVRVNRIPDRAREWLAQAEPEERVVIERFAAGINAYAEQHPDALDPAMRRVLPATPEDVLAHAQRVVHFTFVASPELVAQAQRALRGDADGEGESPADADPDGARRLLGSNAWAVAPARTADGNALLLINPHLPWGDLFTWYEAQITVAASMRTAWRSWACPRSTSRSTLASAGPSP